MGMYSTFNDEDIEWLDKDLCREWLEETIEELKAKGKNSYGQWLESSLYYYEAFLEADLSFNAFNDWKIQSYWYDEWCQFLWEVAPFIKEGITMFGSGKPTLLRVG